MERELRVKEDSIETSGIKKDYKEAIVEYIWNGFDAYATNVEVSYKENKLGGVESITISDNGTGISSNNLENTFDAFLSSEKKVNTNLIDSIHGSKGKGRFSFLGFANNCKWETIYNINGQNYMFSIEISSEKKNKYICTEPIKTNQKVTGTNVTIYNIESLLGEQMRDKELEQFILQNFAWYLYLKKNKNYHLVLNGKEINYKDFVSEELTQDYEEIIGEEKFDIYFINWKDDVKSKYFFHMLDLENNQKYMKHTNYNNNGIGFVHSVYVTSNYFKDFEIYNTNEIDGQMNIANKKNEKDLVYKQLIEKLNKIVTEKYKEFVRKKSNDLIKSFENDKIFPEFSNDIVGKYRKRELENVVKEVYCAQPKIFKGASKQQKQIIVHFLGLLLDSDERENVLSIIENITKLSKEERDNLASTLKKTSLSCIVDLIKMLDWRSEVIESLKSLVFDFDEYTNERNHIQKIMEQNYWIFGEEYYMVTADKPFEKALSEYLYKLDGYKNIQEYKIDNPQKNRRMDIFLAGKRPLMVHQNSTIKEENIILELKAPKVVIGAEIFRQIEDYMELIRNQPQFNSSSRQWKFYAISNEVDNFIKGKYEEYVDRGYPFLVKSVKNYQIFIMTWDDVFKNFEYRYNFIYDKLKLNKESIEKQLIKSEPSRELVDKITEDINGRKIV